MPSNVQGSPAVPECGFSARVVSILQSIGCEFESVNVLDQEFNPGLREIIKQYSAWPTIPQVILTGLILLLVLISFEERKKRAYMRACMWELAVPID